jgi:hypothetical protein
LEGNNFEGQSHEPFAHLAILTVGGGNCQGNSRTTGTIGKTGKRQYCFYQRAPAPLVAEKAALHVSDRALL